MPPPEQAVPLEQRLATSRDPSPAEVERVAERTRWYFRVREGMPDGGAEAPWGAGGGWISPAGVLWPCPDLMHTLEADRIVDVLGLREEGAAGGAEGTLERAAWIHVMDDGYVLGLHRRPFTQAQIDRLFDLVTRFPSMRAKVMAALEEERRESEDRGMSR